MTYQHAADMIAHQATACAELGSPLYGELFARAAEDVRAGGPCAEAIAGYEDATGPQALALRLGGAVHALVLDGRAPALAASYPSAGGTFEPADANAVWRAFRATVATELGWVRTWLRRPPQTNEVGRGNLLVAGLLWATERAVLPVRLFELGASAGLNLRARPLPLRGRGLRLGCAGRRGGTGGRLARHSALVADAGRRPAPGAGGNRTPWLRPRPRGPRPARRLPRAARLRLA